MSIDATPPGWAEALLRAFLAPGDSDSVSGDLLEQYRESVRPARGRRRADTWYVTQALGFVWRSARPWAAVFAAAFIARTALDWLVPPADFHSRATVSTLLGAGIVLLAGFWAASRSGSFAAGPVIGVATAAIAAPIQVLGAATLLAGWHDPITMAAIRGSGGLAEVLTLPFLMVLPGVVLGTIGGFLGAAVKRLRSA
ncbi:MAG TPA: permease prefix domain 2-containing transporter [Thermoanaerobaculia bacterium]|nr:permease prefix domain 2-containing transporter [Thermoanaerobaculia bacterium]